MIFEKYQHIERLGTAGVEGILNGKCYIMPKIDGTNASIWLGEDNEVHCGSRNRDLTEGQDNGGFRAWVQNQPQIKEYLQAHPTQRLYGEWLIPHTIKTYKDEAWRVFYIFDVMEAVEDAEKYLPYDIYQPMLKEYQLTYIEPMAIIDQPTIEELKQLMESNTFLMQPGAIGEGIVIKNYNFINRYKRVQWAKNGAF